MQLWPALEFPEYNYYLKPFRLRAVSHHAEIWVADGDDGVSQGTDFPVGDCRNGAMTAVTDAQAKSLANEFDQRIYPFESHAFEKMPSLDGSTASLPEEIPSIPADAYKGPGQRLVVLVDNFRNPAFYDHTLPSDAPLGVFDDVIVDETGRNVISLWSFDWLHTFGPNPPQQQPPASRCNNFGTSPNLVQGILAHEYQHELGFALHGSYERSWVDEGLSEWTRTHAGYLSSGAVDSRAWDWPLQSFLGFGTNSWLAEVFSGALQGGPQGSLTSWEGANSDYGKSMTFFNYLSERYGNRFVSDVHREPLTGVEGVKAVLARHDPHTSFGDLIDGWAASVALDGIIDDGAHLTGGHRSDFEVRTDHTTVNWDNPDSYEHPGVEPNGSDFVRLRDESGTYLNARQLKSLRFTADSVYPAPLEWTLDPDGHGVGNAALSSGADDNADRTLARQVTVPVTDPTLRFDIRYETEEGWDFGLVQVSTDGGATYHSLPATDTTTDHDPDLVDSIASQVPGYTGDSGGWQSESADLSAYAGQNVIVAFRYLTDAGFHLPGLSIDNVSLGGHQISDGSDLTAWRSTGQLHPDMVEGWSLQLVAYTANHRRAWITKVPHRLGRAATLGVAALQRRLGKRSTTVAAIVTLHDSAGDQHARDPRYSLLVNGVTQPGG